MIVSPSRKWLENRVLLGFPWFRLGNRFADFALIQPLSPPNPLFQFPNLSCVVAWRVAAYLAGFRLTACRIATPLLPRVQRRRLWRHSARCW